MLKRVVPNASPVQTLASNIRNSHGFRLHDFVKSAVLSFHPDRMPAVVRKACENQLIRLVRAATCTPVISLTSGLAVKSFPPPHAGGHIANRSGGPLRHHNFFHLRNCPPASPIPLMVPTRTCRAPVQHRCQAHWRQPSQIVWQCARMVYVFTHPIPFHPAMVVMRSPNSSGTE